MPFPSLVGDFFFGLLTGDFCLPLEGEVDFLAESFLVFLSADGLGLEFFFSCGDFSLPRLFFDSGLLAVP